MPVHERDYAPLAVALNNVGGNRAQRMRSFADAMWRFYKDHGVSWVGFYLLEDVPGDEPPGREQQMVLGPSRDKPACSPIQMHGACGMSCLKQRAIIVSDVSNLGPNYIACDPRDRSEIILPLFDENANAYGVLDIDSFDRNAFGEDDARQLKRLLESTAICWPTPWVQPLYY
ncbi:MAG: GAF domain-containing protein [Planctomycetota bacterium]